MIGAALTALPGVLLLGVGTPRQARMLAGERLTSGGRRVLRIAGMALLFASLVIALDGEDRARHLIGWIGTIGAEALLLALLFTAYGSRSQVRTRPRQSIDRSAEIPLPLALSIDDDRHMTKT